MSMRVLHKWLSIIIGLQVLIWVTSGSIISLLDHGTVKGRTTFIPTPATELNATKPLVDLAALALPNETNVTAVALVRNGPSITYEVQSSKGLFLFDAHTGEPFTVSESSALSTAQSSYSGDGELLKHEFLPDGAEELRKQHGFAPQWRTQFNDSLSTHVYVSGIDGRVLAHRNDYSRVVDFLLMLHFMDYGKEGSFNNWQVRVVGFAALWFAISGLILVKRSFRRRDFAWIKRAT